MEFEEKKKQFEIDKLKIRSMQRKYTENRDDEILKKLDKEAREKAVKEGKLEIVEENIRLRNIQRKEDKIMNELEELRLLEELETKKIRKEKRACRSLCRKDS